MRRSFSALAVAAVVAAIPPSTAGQASPTLSNAVKAYVSVDAPVIALTHARVIDGTGAAPREDQTLIIRDGNIAAIGSFASTPVLEGAHTIDLTAAQVASIGANQQVSVILEDDAAAISFNAKVAWTSFEIQAGSGPRYRAGMEFIDADAEQVEAYCTRQKI